jgi:hypothetical protein
MGLRGLPATDATMSNPSPANRRSQHTSTQKKPRKSVALPFLAAVPIVNLFFGLILGAPVFLLQAALPLHAAVQNTIERVPTILSA